MVFAATRWWDGNAVVVSTTLDRLKLKFPGWDARKLQASKVHVNCSAVESSARIPVAVALAWFVQYPPGRHTPRSLHIYKYYLLQSVRVYQLSYKLM